MEITKQCQLKPKNTVSDTKFNITLVTCGDNGDITDNNNY